MSVPSVQGDPPVPANVVRDHRHTPVLAFSYEPVAQLNVRKDRLTQRGLEPGPWLNRLKQHLLSNETGAPVSLPDGGTATAGDLGAEIILTTSGKNMVYATDFADTDSNRRRLIELAQQAHILFCESTFAEADVEQARRTGHLTTRACAEIATAAGVARLVPFHFSRRYEHEPARLYDEIRLYCECPVEGPD